MALFPLICCALLFAKAHQAQGAGEWSYQDQETWPAQFPECGGRTQSPININTQYSRIGGQADLQFYGYDAPIRSFDLINNGHSIAFDYKARSFSGYRPALSGTVLKQGKYVLAGFHFHWGQRNGEGSEHTFDRLPADMELHLVHYNQDRYDSLVDALQAHDGVAVLAILFSVTPESNPRLTAMVDSVEWYLRTRTNASTAVRTGLFLEDLLPPRRRSMELFTYRGSLTTPNCTSGVQWLVMGAANGIGARQIAVFRSLRNQRGGAIGNNFRETQPLNGRPVTMYRF